MKKSKKTYITFLVLGIILVISAPYLPDALFNIIQLYDYRYTDLRFYTLIPSTSLAGVMVFVIGIAQMIKGDEKK